MAKAAYRPKLLSMFYQRDLLKMKESDGHEEKIYELLKYVREVDAQQEKDLRKEVRKRRS